MANYPVIRRFRVFLIGSPGPLCPTKKPRFAVSIIVRAGILTGMKDK